MERGDATGSHNHASQMINNNVPRQMRVSDQTELEVNALTVLSSSVINCLERKGIVSSAKTIGCVHTDRGRDRDQ